MAQIQEINSLLIPSHQEDLHNRAVLLMRNAGNVLRLTLGPNNIETKACNQMLNDLVHGKLHSGNSPFGGMEKFPAELEMIDESDEINI